MSCHDAASSPFALLSSKPIAIRRVHRPFVVIIHPAASKPIVKFTFAFRRLQSLTFAASCRHAGRI